MAEKNQPGLTQKIKSLCNKSNLTLQTLNNTNEKAFTSHIKQYLRRALADHQLLKTNNLRFGVLFFGGARKPIAWLPRSRAPPMKKTPNRRLQDK